MIEWHLTGDGRLFPYFNNGVFLDGRDATLAEYGLKLHKPSSSLAIKGVRKRGVLLMNISSYFSGT